MAGWASSDGFEVLYDISIDIWSHTSMHVEDTHLVFLL